MEIKKRNIVFLTKSETKRFSKYGLTKQAKDSLDNARASVKRHSSLGIDDSIVDEFILAYYDEEENDIYFSTNGVKEDEFVGSIMAELKDYDEE